MSSKLHNDRIIFSYLTPANNELLSKLSKKDLYEILNYLNKYYLEYRDNIGLSSSETFGIEIEMEHFEYFKQPELIEFQIELYKLINNKNWDVRNDASLFNGREIVSDILVDKTLCWEEIKKACYLASVNGKIDVNSAAHVHVGAQILGENPIYWYRLFKLWSIYENVIYRFCYGEYLTQRPNIEKFARPAACFLQERLELLDKNLDYSLFEMLRIIEPKGLPQKYTKKFGISYWKMLFDDNFDPYEDFNKFHEGCTIEFRSSNPTFDEIIWQNNINFFIKLMLYCKSDRYDEDIIDRRKLEVEPLFSNLDAYSKIYLDQAIELCDMIFDNNLDKIYFLRQYLKSFDVANKPFVRARKFTANSFK